LRITVATVPNALHDMAEPLALPQVMILVSGAGVGVGWGDAPLRYDTSNSARQPWLAQMKDSVLPQLVSLRQRPPLRSRTSRTPLASLPMPHCTWVPEAFPQVMRRVSGIVGAATW
jgi:hypothetical protein